MSQVLARGWSGQLKLNEIVRDWQSRAAKHRVIGKLKVSIDREVSGLSVSKRKYSLYFSDEVEAPHDIILSREGEQTIILVSKYFNHHDVYWIIRDKISTYYYWFLSANPEVSFMRASACDGDKFSRARFAFSSNSASIVPVPDSHFFLQRGYWEIDDIVKGKQIGWENRSDDLVWRGALNGNGHVSVDPNMADNPGVMQRLRMAAAAKKAGIDFKFVPTDGTSLMVALEYASFLAEPIDSHSWGQRKYAIDIDGYTNAWSNLLCRMKLGCCVLKVESQFGFRQWYYDKIAPFVHYVPVKADLSDLGDKVAWLREHDREAQQIATEAQNFAGPMTFETETAVAAQIIDENWNH